MEKVQTLRDCIDVVRANRAAKSFSKGIPSPGHRFYVTRYYSDFRLFSYCSTWEADQHYKILMVVLEGSISSV